EDELPGASRRVVVLDDRELAAREALRVLARVAYRGRRADDARPGAVALRQPEEAHDDVRDVGAEHAPVRVELVEDDQFERSEEPGPALVIRQDAVVEHVGVSERAAHALTHA